MYVIYFIPLHLLLHSLFISFILYYRIILWIQLSERLSKIIKIILFIVNFSSHGKGNEDVFYVTGLSSQRKRRTSKLCSPNGVKGYPPWQNSFTIGPLYDYPHSVPTVTDPYSLPGRVADISYFVVDFYNGSTQPRLLLLSLSVNVMNYFGVPWGTLLIPFEISLTLLDVVVHPRTRKRYKISHLSYSLSTKCHLDPRE